MLRVVFDGALTRVRQTSRGLHAICRLITDESRVAVEMPSSFAALRTFNPDGSTLPLPVPAERLTTSAATVDGSPATVLATRDRSLAAVVWVKDGVVTVVAGPLDASEVLAVAQGLR